MARWLDRALLAALTRNWDKNTVRNYSDRVRKHEESIPPAIAKTFQIIDVKAAGLLTHVSMMIAGLGLLVPLVATRPVEEAIIVFEIAVYLLLAVGCLRCLSVFHPQELSASKAELKARTNGELMLRRELYGFCIRVAIVFTVLVLATLPVLYVW